MHSHTKTMGSATISVVWAALLLLFLSFYSFSPPHPLLYINSLQPTSTMDIKMRTSTIKDKPPKLAAAAIPSQRSTRGSSESPRAANINSLLAKINLLKSWSDGVLTALSSPGGRNDGLNSPCDLVPLAMERFSQALHPVSPTSVEDCSAALAPQEKEGQCANPTVKPIIRINKSPASAQPSINKATSACKQTPSLILRP